MAICSALAGGHAGLGVKQVQVAKGVHHFLVGGGLEGAGGVLVTHLTRQLGEVAVLDVRHGFAGKGGFEVGHGFDLGAMADHWGLRLIALINRKMRNHRFNPLIAPIESC